LPVINVPGIGDVYADGFAEEQTMQRILMALSDGNNANSAEAQQNLASASNTAAGSVIGLGNASRKTGSDTKVAGQTAGQGLRAAGQAGFGFSTMMSRQSRNLSNSVKNLESQPFAIGTAIAGLVSEAGSAITKFVPNILAKAAGMVAVGGAAIAGFIFEKLNATASAFQKVQQSGAILGGSLLELRLNAHGANLTMSEFGNIMARNGEAMASFAGGTTRGAREFARANQALTQLHSRELLQLGYSFEDMGMATADMMQQFALSGIAIQRSGIHTTEFANATMNAVRQQKIMAAVTGRTIEQQKAAERALRRDAQVQAAIQNLGPAMQTQIKSLIASVPQMKDVILDQVMSGQLMHKNSLIMAGMAPETVEQMRSTVNAIKNGALDGDAAKFFKGISANSDIIKQETKNMGEFTNLSRFVSGNEFLNLAKSTFTQQQDLMTAAINATIKDIGQDVARVKTAIDPMTESLIDLTVQNRELGMSLSKLTTGMLANSSFLIKGLTGLISTLQAGVDFVNKGFNSPGKTKVGGYNSEVTTRKIVLPDTNVLTNNDPMSPGNQIDDINSSGKGIIETASLKRYVDPNKPQVIEAPGLANQLDQLIKLTRTNNNRVDQLTQQLT